MLGTDEEFTAATERLKGKRVRLLGSHPWAGSSAEVVSFDRIGMKVKLLRGDAYGGHEAYVTERKHYRPEIAGVDW
jgi:hypothetical protein